MSEEKLSTNTCEIVCQSKDDTKKSILSISLMEEIVNSLVKAHLKFASKALGDDEKIVVFVPPEIWNTVKKLPVIPQEGNSEEKGKWRVRKDEENTYFLSESLQSSSLDSEAFQLFKSVANDDDIQIPDLEKKLVEENGFVILNQHLDVSALF